MFHDRYERINFWSHLLPGLAFLALGAAALAGAAPGGRALGVFGLCTAATHLLSALTHVYPDNHALEKMDHLGIVATIVGTPLTGVMAQESGHAPPAMLLAAAGLAGAAFLRPLPRVLGFVGLGSLLGEQPAGGLHPGRREERGRGRGEGGARPVPQGGSFCNRSFWRATHCPLPAPPQRCGTGPAW